MERGIINMNSMIKNSLILCTITLVAGILLGAVYEITKEPRAEQKEKAKNNAYKAVFENYDEFKDVNSSEIKFENIDISKVKDLDKSLKENNLNGKAVIDGAVKAIYDDKNIGMVINVTSKGGYGGDISFSVGFSKDMKITGISILSIGETPGLGMKASEDSFLNQYVGKEKGHFVVDKDNKEGSDNQIDSISGATITSRAMTDGVNAAYVALDAIITGGEK